MCLQALRQPLHRGGRKRVLLLFQALSAVSVLPCAFLGNPLLVPWLLILASFFLGAVHPVTSAILTDLTPPAKRKQAFSLLYLGQNIGFALGPLIAGFLFLHHTPWIFLGDAATTLASLLFILLFVSESRPSPEAVEKSLSEDRGPERAEKGPLLYVLWRRPFVLAFLLVQVLFSFVYAQAGFSLPLQLSAFFGEQGPQRFGLLMSVNGLVVIFLTTPLIYITERVNPLLSVSLAGILYALGFGMIPLIRGMGLFVLSTAVWTLGEILWATNSNVYIAGHTPMSHRGGFNSIAPIMTRAGNALGPPLMGAFIERFGVARVWPIMLGLASLGAALLLLLHFFERGGGSGRFRWPG